MTIAFVKLIKDHIADNSTPSLRSRHKELTRKKILLFLVTCEKTLWFVSLGLFMWNWTFDVWCQNEKQL